MPFRAAAPSPKWNSAEEHELLSAYDNAPSSEAAEEDWEQVYGAHSTSSRAHNGVLQRAMAVDDGTTLRELDAEISSLDGQISGLQQLRKRLAVERTELTKKHGAVRPLAGPSRAAAMPSNGIDFFASDHENAKRVKKTMLDVWGIHDFRASQEGAINAVLSGRDTVCIMPTGAGKSLCFQLPALLSTGTTIVISPLISLMNDQVLNLQDVGVSAVALTSALTKQQNDAILKRLLQKQEHKNTGVRIVYGDEDRASESETKLCYITPERFAKSKTLVGALSQLTSMGRLSRFVIDEAHCVSQMGHDYRPDYRKLSLLRQLFPAVPIVALTATCSPRVLDDMLRMLSMRPPTDGRAANSTGTVLFRSPLYRSNLHWSVLPKPSNAKEALQALADWITERHADETGIVYCLSQKDTETIAEGLRTASNNTIKTGVYHAGLDEAEKDRVHHRWRDKKIGVVVATIAFGLGIDKPDVRFVAHHTLSKSLEGLYQEAGRAGRDGKDSDCALFFRKQDAARLSSIMAGEPEGQAKLHSILKYAQDMQTCRKVLFSRYFAGRSAATFAPANGEDEENETPCGHCDNCLRDLDSFETIDVRVDAWRMLKILDAVRRQDGRVTNAQLADLSRGLGGGSFSTQGDKGKAGKASIDIAVVAGAKVSLSKDDAETLAMELLLQGYISDMLYGTAYTVLVYQQLGKNAMRLLRLSLKEVEQGGGPKIEITVPARGGKAKRKAPSAKSKPSNSVKKRTRVVSQSPGETSAFRESDGELRLPSTLQPMEEDSDEDTDGDGWEDVTTAHVAPPKKKARAQVLELSD